jgi:hypothetical protein
MCEYLLHFNANINGGKKKKERKKEKKTVINVQLVLKVKEHNFTEHT